MPTVFDLIVRNGTIVNHNGTGPADIGVVNGKIAALGDLATASAGEVIDATGLTILPGVIDSQVHFREPGMEHKEDLASGSHGAVLGGVTSVFEMPNTRPTTTDADALADKITRATGRMACDFAFWFGATAENVDDLAEAERLPRGGRSVIAPGLARCHGGVSVYRPPDQAGVGDEAADSRPAYLDRGRAAPAGRA